MSSNFLKKLLFFLLLFISIPIIVINIYSKKNNFYYIKNDYIRIKYKDIIIKENINNYLIGVIASEIPISFNDEAIKAQIIASRTYAINKIDYNKEYDVDATTNTQVYKNEEEIKKLWGDNYAKNLKRINYLIKTTKNEIITYKNNIINAMFFSTSCGQTENSENVFNNYVPYLRSVKIDDNINSPYFNSITKVKKQDIKDIYNLNDNELNNINIKKVNNSERIEYIKFGEKKINGYEFSRTIKLKSNCFTLRNDDEFLTFTVKGYGHGVGMSQYGANYLSSKGYSYIQIIKYFYKDVEIKKLKYKN